MQSHFLLNILTQLIYPSRSKKIQVVKDFVLQLLRQCIDALIILISNVIFNIFIFLCADNQPPKLWLFKMISL